MRILDRRELNLIPIFVVASTGLQIILLFLVLALTAKVGKIANSKTPTLVELNDGTSVRVAPAGHSDRTPQAISDFVAQTITGLMNWNAVLPVTEKYRKMPQLDPGVPLGDKKVTTATWNAGFGLSEDFREPFLKELANLTPAGVFTGKTQSTLIVRYISPPQKLESGTWKLNVIANLVIFFEEQLGKAIAFNKTVYVRSVDTPSLPQNPSSLQKSVYKARSAGLEIYKIRDLDIGN